MLSVPIIRSAFTPTNECAITSSRTRQLDLRSGKVYLTFARMDKFGVEMVRMEEILRHVIKTVSEKDASVTIDENRSCICLEHHSTQGFHYHLYVEFSGDIRHKTAKDSKYHENYFDYYADGPSNPPIHPHISKREWKLDSRSRVTRYIRKDGNWVNANGLSYGHAYHPSPPTQGESLSERQHRETQEKKAKDAMTIHRTMDYSQRDGRLRCFCHPGEADPSVYKCLYHSDLSPEEKNTNCACDIEPCFFHLASTCDCEVKTPCTGQRTTCYKYIPIREKKDSEDKAVYLSLRVEGKSHSMAVKACYNRGLFAPYPGDPIDHISKVTEGLKIPDKPAEVPAAPAPSFNDMCKAYYAARGIEVNKVEVKKVEMKKNIPPPPMRAATEDEKKQLEENFESDMEKFGAEVAERLCQCEKKELDMEKKTRNLVIEHYNWIVSEKGEKTAKYNVPKLWWEGYYRKRMAEEREEMTS